MRNVTEAQKKAYMTGKQKYLTLRFSDGTVLTGEGVNSPINEGSMRLEQTLCSEEQIHFGLCNAASFEVQIVAEQKRYKGMYVYPTITSNNVSFNLGKFRIENDELTDDRYYRTLTCYDQMTDLMTDDVSGWYAGLNLPMSLKNFRNSLFTYFQQKYGVKQAALKIQGKSVSSLPNDDMVVQRTIDSDNPIDGQEVLERICEINGCFGVINEDGDFEYRFIAYDERLYPADDLFPANDLYPIGGADVIGGDPDDVEANYIQASLVWQEYEYQPITKVQVHQTENDVGAIVGEDGNDYEVYDNFLVYGMGAPELQTVAENILNTIKKTIAYTPARVAVRGRPWLQTGDLLEVVCRGRTIMFPMLQRVMSGITALKDEYEAQGQEYFSFDITETNHEIYGILRKTFEITKNVDGLQTYATEIDTNFQTFTSTLWQRAKEIGVDVSNGLNHATLVALINDLGESQVQISAQSIELNGYVTFHDLETPGETVINGSNIVTGTLNADLIRTGTITNDSGNFVLDVEQGIFNIHGINIIRRYSGSGWKTVTSLGTSAFNKGMSGLTMGTDQGWLTSYSTDGILLGGQGLLHDYDFGLGNHLDLVQSSGQREIRLYSSILTQSNEYGVTGTYNGLRFVDGICVGT